MYRLVHKRDGGLCDSYSTREKKNRTDESQDARDLNVNQKNVNVRYEHIRRRHVPTLRFNDFTYEHASINKKGILVYGGLAVGEGAGRNATAEAEFKGSYGRLMAKVFNNKKRLGTASNVLWYD